jgi:hypothetical protein
VTLDGECRELVETPCPEAGSNVAVEHIAIGLGGLPPHALLDGRLKPVVKVGVERHLGLRNCRPACPVLEHLVEEALRVSLELEGLHGLEGLAVGLDPDPDPDLPTDPAGPR